MSAEAVTTESFRADLCAALEATDAAAKARASVVRSCAEVKGLSEAELESLRDLLRCITEQRKRLRALRRLWQSLDAYERPSAELVDATTLCLAECQEVASAIEPLREYTIDQVASTVLLTWTRLMNAASRFTDQDGPEGGPPRTGFRLTPSR